MTADTEDRTCPGCGRDHDTTGDRTGSTDNIEAFVACLSTTMDQVWADMAAESGGDTEVIWGRAGVDPRRFLSIAGRVYWEFGPRTDRATSAFFNAVGDALYDSAMRLGHDANCDCGEPVSGAPLNMGAGIHHYVRDMEPTEAFVAGLCVAVLTGIINAFPSDPMARVDALRETMRETLAQDVNAPPDIAAAVEQALNEITAGDDEPVVSVPREREWSANFAMGVAVLAAQDQGIEPEFEDEDAD
jgi:hypothetical protein